MALVKFEPLSMLRELDRFFDDRFSEPFEGSTAWVPRTDIIDREKALLVRVELPGLKGDDVEVTVEDDVLTIKGQRTFVQESEKDNIYRKEIREGEFSRSMRLPKGLDQESVSATFTNGMLEVTIPKTSEVLPKKIAIEVKD